MLYTFTAPYTIKGAGACQQVKQQDPAGRGNQTLCMIVFDSHQNADKERRKIKAEGAKEMRRSQHRVAMTGKRPAYP
ncbi:hypothetical protein, partial [Dictyobacter arantiisoli]|uniref:hypothetical protein n=1 Tax=Dictyobacter arantiisoli TaxID=2014874 RepID=UPI001C0E92F0